MRQLHQLLALALFSTAAAIAGAAAQTTDRELDLEAIRARAQQQSADAEALATSARNRAERLTRDAKASAADAQAHGESYAKQARANAKANPSVTFDFDTMVANAGTMAEAAIGDAPRFIAFASTSMPPGTLRQMIDDVGRAGGVVVFRGLPQNNAKALTAALAKVERQGEALAGVGIDPRLFRAFGIDAVPAYVVATSDFDLCDGFDCTTEVPPHDRMTGNVTAAYALEAFARGGGPGARIAEKYLKRFEGSAR